jgi:hypothetical protein
VRALKLFLLKLLNMFRVGVFSRKKYKQYFPPPTFSVLANIKAISATAVGELDGSNMSTYVVIPSSVAVGMDILIHVTNKLGTHRPRIAKSYGFKRIDTWVAATSNNGSDRGPIVSTLYVKTSDGTEASTIVPIELTNGNCLQATVLVIEKDSGANLHYQICGGQRTKPDTSLYQCRSYSAITFAKNDLILTLTSVNTDSLNYQIQSLDVDGESGLFGTVSQNLYQSGTNIGNDSMQMASVFRALNPFTGHLIYNALPYGVPVGTDNPTGITIFIRIHQDLSDFTWWPSGLRVSLPSDLSALTDRDLLEDGGPICHGDRADWDGPNAGETRYELTTLGGDPALKITADLTTGMNTRTEKGFAPWFPDYPIGTQIIEEVYWKTDGSPNDPSQGGVGSNPLGEWIISQNHPGSPAVGTFSSNHPPFYFGWSYAGQTGWDNLPGPAGAGEFIVVINAALQADGVTPNTIRNRYPDITWGPNKTFKIRYHVRADIAANDPTEPGEPCMKVWVNDELIFEDYVNGTVSKTDAQLGTRSRVLGQGKKGIYHHSIKTEGIRSNNIAAGHKGLVLYELAEKRIIQFPDDIDYIEDITNNSLDAYNFIKT